VSHACKRRIDGSPIPPFFAAAEAPGGSASAASHSGTPSSEGEESGSGSDDEEGEGEGGAPLAQQHRAPKRPRSDADSAAARRRRRNPYGQIRKEDRCGVCDHCLNPQKKKPCIPARERQMAAARAAGVDPDDFSDSGSRQPAPKKRRAGEAALDVAEELRPLVDRDGGVALGKGAAAARLMRRQTRPLLRNFFCTVIGLTKPLVSPPPPAGSAPPWRPRHAARAAAAAQPSPAQAAAWVSLAALRGPAARTAAPHPPLLGLAVDAVWTRQPPCTHTPPPIVWQAISEFMSVGGAAVLETWVNDSRDELGSEHINLLKALCEALKVRARPGLPALGLPGCPPAQLVAVVTSTPRPVPQRAAGGI
jgi:hypothetical protein